MLQKPAGKEISGLGCSITVALFETISYFSGINEVFTWTIQIAQLNNNRHAINNNQQACNTNRQTGNFNRQAGNIFFFLWPVGFQICV